MSNADKDGTFTSSGSQGGTEMMLAGLKKYADPKLLDQFNIICSRVRYIDTDRKNILWLHDLWQDPEVSHLRDARSLGKFTKLVFVSHYQQATYNIGLGVPYSAGIVMQNAIDSFPQHTKPDATDGRVNLIYHTTPHRGLELLIPSFIELTKYFPNIHLDVYSSFKAYGWEERDKPYQELFDICREHPQISYHGFQPNSVVRTALEKAHIFAYPSIWTETSCIAMIEAMSAGCDVVCPSSGALPETAANFALMYPFTENVDVHVNNFANVLINAIETYTNPAFVNRRSVQRLYFDRIYNWKYRANQWNNLFTYLLNGGA